MAITNYVFPITTPHIHELKIRKTTEYPQNPLQLFTTWADELGFIIGSSPVDHVYSSSVPNNIEVGKSFYDPSYSYVSKIAMAGVPQAFGPLGTSESTLQSTVNLPGFFSYVRVPYNAQPIWYFMFDADVGGVRINSQYFYRDAVNNILIFYVNFESTASGSREWQWCCWVEENNIRCAISQVNAAGGSGEVRIVQCTDGAVQEDIEVFNTLTLHDFGPNVDIGTTVLFEFATTKYNVSGKILEDLNINKWQVVIQDEATGVIRRDETIDTSVSFDFDLDFPSNNPVYMTARVKALMWKPGINYAQNDIVYPTTPIDKPYYYRCEVAGTSSSSEPVWPTTQNATIADNTITWRRIDRLVQPQMQGPIIPLEVLT